MGRRPKKNQSPDRSADSGEPRTTSRFAVLVLCGLLLLAIALVFSQTLDHEFVNFDDDTYLLENANLPRGFTPGGIAWAFTATECHNWHPLTWLSYMLDYQLYDLKPAGYHLSNVLLHAATAILLLLVLRQMTGDLWPSAFVAAVFALHPLRAESVAWAAERKDVLSGLFFMLTLGAYVYYVRRPFSWARYGLVALLFALGLMAKPMLVTLPLVLLLLDYWPLGRMTLGWRLVLEKLPLLALSAASCVITSVAQGAAIRPLDAMPLSARIANALVSYVAYLAQFFWPARLAVAYPHQGDNLPVWQVAGALLLLAGVSVGAWVWRRKCPWLLVGWCWYLGMLVPVIGLVQVGFQAMADRYTYLPEIGLAIGLTWGAKRFLESKKRESKKGTGSEPTNVKAAKDNGREVPVPLFLRIATALVLAALMGCAWQQTSYWRNSETLWRHAIDSTLPNSVAHFNLGDLLDRRGQTDEAMAEYRKTLEIKPDDVDALTNLGIDLANRGQTAEAIIHLREALKIMPNRAEIHFNLSIYLLEAKQVDDAIDHLRQAIAINPKFPQAENYLGVALARRGQRDEAIAHYQQALELEPNYAEARKNLADALKQKRLAK